MSGQEIRNTPHPNFDSSIQHRYPRNKSDLQMKKKKFVVRNTSECSKFACSWGKQGIWVTLNAAWLRDQERRVPIFMKPLFFFLLFFNNSFESLKMTDKPKKSKWNQNYGRKSLVNKRSARWPTRIIGSSRRPKTQPIAAHYKSVSF